MATMEALYRAVREGVLRKAAARRAQRERARVRGEQEAQREVVRRKLAAHAAVYEALAEEGVFFPEHGARRVSGWRLSSLNDYGREDDGTR